MITPKEEEMWFHSNLGLVVLISKWNAREWVCRIVGTEGKRILMDSLLVVKIECVDIEGHKVCQGVKRDGTIFALPKEAISWEKVAS